MADSVAQRYLRLGLRLDRHVEGTVDAYFGPPELAEEVKAEEKADPGRLVAEAEALLGELGDGWLRDQVLGLRIYAGVLAGEEVSYADEVEGCYGIRPEHTDEATFAAAHEELERLLPGEGSLAERLERRRDASLVPNEKIESTIAAVIDEARAQTREIVDLPEGEGIVLETVSDVPWLGANFYQGGLRGRVVVNVGLKMSAIDLLILAIHETYPGHQAERTVKEQLLVRDEGLLEETIVMTPTPQSLVTEGIGRVAPHILLEGEGADRFARIVHDAGVEFDLAHELEIERVSEPCRWAEVNAALMMYDGGASRKQAHAYLARWGLLTPDMVDHLIRFITQPTSRSYVMNYEAGFELCQRYSEAKGFRSLLTERVRVRDLLEAKG
ncbi:MAG TPA: hypothetical protein VFC19_35015 [Candidatus Limnocylindrales bacterium]|nr:hypothetical protein [Candidatus Limnocylindrales bacterium]